MALKEGGSVRPQAEQGRSGLAKRAGSFPSYFIIFITFTHTKQV